MSINNSEKPALPAGSSSSKKVQFVKLLAKILRDTERTARQYVRLIAKEGAAADAIRAEMAGFSKAAFEDLELIGRGQRKATWDSPFVKESMGLKSANN